jgi:AGCS family alanine or glycine:cation symporter
VLPWFPIPLAVVVMLFAYSTMIAWSYYGLEGWMYLFGRSGIARHSYNLIFLGGVTLGCVVQLQAVLDFSDAMVFAMAFTNMIALYLLAPVVRRELDAYRARLASGAIRPTVKR